MKHEKLRCFKAKKKGFFFSKNMKSYTKDSSKSYAKTKQIKKISRTPMCGDTWKTKAV